MKIPATQLTVSTAAATSAVQAAKVQITPLAGQVDAIKGKLGQLKERLEGFDGEVISAGDRFKENAFGSANVGNKVGGFFDQVRSQGTGNSRNPLDGAIMDNFSGGKAGHYSDDDEDGGFIEGVKNWFMSVLGSGAGGAGAKTLAGSGAGVVGGTAFGIITANTGSPEDKANEVRGIGAFLDLADGNYYRSDMPGPDGTPLPDDMGSSPTIVTGADIKGIKARKGSTGEPTGDEPSSGAGGVAVPKTEQQGEWVNDGVGASVVVDSIAMKGIEARINANITIIR